MFGEIGLVRRLEPRLMRRLGFRYSFLGAEQSLERILAAFAGAANQTGEFGERIGGGRGAGGRALRRRGGGAQPAFEFVQIQFRTIFGGELTHDQPLAQLENAGDGGS